MASLLRLHAKPANPYEKINVAQVATNPLSFEHLNII